ncbi:MAG: hypothetical protein PHF86_08420 [Candidatus Nanoarchaeia archaeon]|jgi:hypothetical protein|nr:hypothetical protein [Candidatus Nanoarchaeia archaeon]
MKDFNKEQFAEMVKNTKEKEIKNAQEQIIDRMKTFISYYENEKKWPEYDTGLLIQQIENLNGLKKEYNGMKQIFDLITEDKEL